MNIKKFLIGTAAAVAIFATSALPAFAAQPVTPGCIGDAVSGQAISWGGRGEVVSAIAQTGAYGDGVKAYLASDPCGH